MTFFGLPPPQKKKLGPPLKIVSILLSALVERFTVSRMRDSYYVILFINKSFNINIVLSSLYGFSITDENLIFETLKWSESAKNSKFLHARTQPCVHSVKSLTLEFFFENMMLAYLQLIWFSLCYGNVFFFIFFI